MVNYVANFLIRSRTIKVELSKLLAFQLFPRVRTCATVLNTPTERSRRECVQVFAKRVPLCAVVPFSFGAASTIAIRLHYLPRHSIAQRLTIELEKSNKRVTKPFHFTLFTSVFLPDTLYALPKSKKRKSCYQRVLSKMCG